MRPQTDYMMVLSTRPVYARPTLAQLAPTPLSSWSFLLRDAGLDSFPFGSQEGSEDDVARIGEGMKNKSWSPHKAGYGAAEEVRAADKSGQSST